jgi:2-(3-amino-3-carboxypropyl)histidine synthase
MKIFYVPAKQQVRISTQFAKDFSKRIPKNIGLVSTIQFSYLIPELANILKSEGKNIFVYGKGQVLGCNFDSVIKIQDKVDAFIYLGSGKFHPLQFSLKLKQKKQIFLFNPVIEQFTEFDWKDTEKIKLQKKALQVKFLSSNKIGILVSTKPGQSKLKEALELKSKLEKKGKKTYLFIMDNFISDQLENWQDLTWINTACPGLAQDFNLLNFSDILDSTPERV